ncbi:hypothetical protein GCK32_011389 [Trichostrongylus colubriformis]|uniref:Uncharacterized protein n=1 Tax=Trichostrongylus colubriformis TaxID=6319 RepID=A0AAN8F2E7_TRICO
MFQCDDSEYLVMSKSSNGTNSRSGSSVRHDSANEKSSSECMLIKEREPSKILLSSNSAQLYILQHNRDSLYNENGFGP